MTTRDLLVCAVLGVATAILMIAVSPATASIAVLSPPAYSFVAGYSAVAPLLALRLSGRAGTATIAAFCTSIIAWPFTALGLLVFVALVIPAIAMDLVFLAAARRGERRTLWLSAVAGGIVIFLLSLPVISPEQLTPLTVFLTLAGRLVSYALACWVAVWLSRALRATGVVRSSRATSGDSE